MSRSRLYLISIIPGLIGIFFIGRENNSHSPHNSGIQQAPDSADIIIDKSIEALGGKEKLTSIQSLYMEGTVILRGQKANSKTWIVNNKASRSEFSFGGFTSWSIVRPDSGWSFNPRRGQKFPEPMTADRIKAAKADLDIQGSLVDYKTKGYKVTYEGTDQIEGSDVYKIEEKLNESVTKIFYLDKDSYLVMRVRTKNTTPNRVNYSNADYSNYQKTNGGYIFPMETGNVKYSLITVNPVISDQLFIPTK
jgi:hypothetical protein